MTDHKEDKQPQQTHPASGSRFLRIKQFVLQRAHNLQRTHLLLFVLLFAAIGTYALYRSFAAPIPNSSQLVSLSGELEVLGFDNFKLDKDGKPEPDVSKWEHHEEFNLKAADGQKYRLEFAGPEPELLTGSKVNIRGRKDGSTIKLASRGGSDFEVTYKALPHHSPRKTAVILITWADNPVKPVDVATIKRQIFGTEWLNPGSEEPPVNLYYRETSYNERSLTGKINPDGDVFGWYAVPTTSKNCFYGYWRTEAYEMATAEGHDLSGYDNFVYLWPDGNYAATNCGFSGIAQVGGNTAYAGIVNSRGIYPWVLAHELGHNFGARHANGRFCYDTNNLPVAMSANCKDIEYQDAYNVMGNSNYLQMNATHKSVLGWLQPSNTQTVTATGDYSLTPLENGDSSVKQLKIIQPAKGKTYYPNYCVELRQPYGVIDGRTSATEPERSQYYGVLIRQAADCTSSAATYIIDTTPTTLGPGGSRDAGLKTGKTFTDPISGISITAVSITPGEAVVRVAFNGRSVSTNNAACSLQNTPMAVKPGSSFTTNMVIKNTGSKAWKAADYDLASVEVVPHPWSSGVYAQTSSNTWGTASIALNGDVATGASATVSATLTAPSLPGSYEFDWRMHQKSQDEWFGAPCQSIMVVNDDITPPALPTNLVVGAKTSNSVSLNWTAATDNVGVAGYKIYRSTSTTSKGKTITSTSLAGYSFSLNFTDTGLTAGTTYSYYVVAYDAAKNDSPSSNSVSVAL
ncbi:MAG: NBR1-Ig-like domain-containing protein [Patescibacteria group bacterium]